MVYSRKQLDKAIEMYDKATGMKASDLCSVAPTNAGDPRSSQHNYVISDM